MISQTAEYALRAVIWLAHCHDSAQTTEQIAESTKVPSGYLSKVLQTLVRADLVSSQRGLGGGYLLLRDPSQLTVLDVINAVDRIKRIKNCPLGLKEHGKRLCALHYRLDAAISLIEDSFRACTIKDLCETKGMTSPLCADTGPDEKHDEEERKNDE